MEPPGIRWNVWWWCAIWMVASKPTDRIAPIVPGVGRTMGVVLSVLGGLLLLRPAAADVRVDRTKCGICSGVACSDTFCLPRFDLR